ncbi:MAG TPA: rhomboid family intramembrane serine protease [Hyphomicrobiaceae bacterium]|nr:rhomboid family intramembrane serine protease [Hyphomicrobiaceae bacterium]
MFVPLYDDNTLKSIRFQFVTIALIAVNVAIYLLEASGLDEAAIASFALIPRELFDMSLPGAGTIETVNVPAMPEQLTLVSYMFFHGDVFHLAGNMLFLWVFGDNVEDAMGHIKFLVFFLACGVFAGLFHAWLAPASESPLIGASGAVAGVIAAYLMLHPHVRVWVLAFKAIPLRISAALALGLWILMQVVMVLLPEAGPVAWWAHIGGLIAGAVLILFMRRPGVPLFDKGLGLA